LPLEGERKPWLIVPHAGNSGSSQGTLSPDGRWLAFSSTESGVSQVYVVAFPGGQGKWQVSTNDGLAPLWRRDGKELYYFSNVTRTVFAVPVKETNDTLQFGATQALATNPASFGGGLYDVTPDGKKILQNVVSQQVSQSVTVATNFPAGFMK
jgi:Tol biopolymer transport system component